MGWRSPRSRAESAFTLLDLARDLGVGVHSFVSLGAKLDVSSNDLLAAWMDDAQVAAAALHLESFGNALKFARTARRFAERKPLLGVVGGRSTGSAVGVDALFAQAGVIPCRSATEVAETAALLLGQPLPDGYRVGVVTNAGGMGMLVADLADAEGLSVPELSSEVQTTVQRGGARRGPHPQPGRPRRRPVPRRPRGRCTGAARRYPSSTRSWSSWSPPAWPTPPGCSMPSSRAGAQSDRPVLLVASNAAEHAQPRRGRPSTEPRRRRWGRWRARCGTPRGGGSRPRNRPRRWASGPPSPARGPSSGSLRVAGGAEWLPAAASAELLGAVRHRAGRRPGQDAEEAGRAAAAIGFPVAVKVADPTILHKTDRGLVRVGLQTPAEVAAAVDAFRAELGSDSVDVRVQPVLAGVEVACGVVRDAVFGPLVRVAAGGVATEIWKDEVYLLPPVASADAGAGPARAAPVAAARRLPRQRRRRRRGAEAVLVGVGQLAVDVPQVSDLDLNPLLVTPDGVHCVDVKVRLQASDALDAGIPRRLRLASSR